MLKNFFLLLIINLFILPVMASTERLRCEEDLEKIKTDITDMMKATQKGNFDIIVKYSYPQLIEVAGGKSKYIQLMSNTFDMIKKNQMELTINSISAPSNDILLSDKEVCTIPTNSIMKTNTKNGRIESYMIAIRDFGNNTWTYLNGVDSSKQAMFSLLIKGLPTDFQFPKHEIIFE